MCFSGGKFDWSWSLSRDSLRLRGGTSLRKGRFVPCYAKALVFPQSGFELNVFLPVYNELKSMPIIRRNISVIQSIFPRAKFLISDNRSTDGTWRELLRLKDDLNGALRLHRQSQNVGFSKNLMAVGQLEDRSMVMMIGASDLVTREGLIHLSRALKSDPQLDFVMCNWAYFEDVNGRKKILYTGDVTMPFTARSLDDFFGRHIYPPNGIMQWVARKEILAKVAPYTHLVNPQLGAFFDAFPCRFLALGNPPLCMVRHIEETGWRSTASLILTTHIIQCKETIAHIERCVDRGSLKKSIADYIHFVFWRIPFVMTAQMLGGRWKGLRLKFDRKVTVGLFSIKRPKYTYLIRAVRNVIRRAIRLTVFPPRFPAWNFITRN